MRRLTPTVSSVGKMVAGRLAAFAGGPVVMVLRFLLARRRRRWVVFAVVALSVSFFMATVTAVVQQPMYIADVVTHRLFGSGAPNGGKWEDSPAPDICAAPPTTAVPVSPPSTYIPQDPALDTEGGDEPIPETVPPAPPPPALNENGKITAQVREIINKVPDNSDMTVAQTYILYRLAHPESQFPQDWSEWVSMFYASGSTLSKNPSALDVASTMDPGADYRPYVLVSDAATYLLLKQHKLSADQRRITQLLSSLIKTCRDGSGASTPSTHVPAVDTPPRDTPSTVESVPSSSAFVGG